ncbi:hypothetical protein DEU56DRAFT_405891 [Suillus clintonianus]|uniref:uncharacterized protein n=1 Tax=Suillus clintonianus TaxID=1904413 RepID=UPI001B85CE3E|nr:uncharacterized protein DEU56DRAFT_405891 [Suillus clintonianus]KAG2134853.1 hypothetical protein DEU56DRAFT_405891 [Suillus clintonianus]
MSLILCLYLIFVLCSSYSHAIAHYCMLALLTGMVLSQTYSQSTYSGDVSTAGQSISCSAIRPLPSHVLAAQVKLRSQMARVFKLGQSMHSIYIRASEALTAVVVMIIIIEGHRHAWEANKSHSVTVTSVDR